MKTPTKQDKLKKLFKGKDSYAEEVKEAKAIKSGKISPAEYAKGEDMEKAKKMKCGGKVKKFAEGGKVKPAPKEVVPDFAKDKNQDVKNQKAAENYAKTRKFAKGGGIERKGKTKGRMI